MHLILIFILSYYLIELCSIIIVKEFDHSTLSILSIIAILIIISIINTFYLFFDCFKTKKITIDYYSINLYSNNKLTKNIFWNEISLIENQHHIGIGPNYSISILDKKHKILLFLTDYNGPNQKNMIIFFLKINKIALKHSNIIIKDKLNWKKYIE